MHLNPAAPVLALPDHKVQLGWDAPLVLVDLAAPQGRFLRSLEGGRHISPAEQRRHAPLLRQLDDAGLLEHDADPAARAACVRVQGGGALGTEAAVTLARAGVAVAVVDRARARQQAAPHLPDPDCGAVALAKVRAAVPYADIRSAHARAALDVVISAGPALARARELLAADQPHLLVECGDQGVNVGPLVVPGLSACHMCVGLYEAQRRPEWPVLALQSDSRRPRVAPATATLAGALIAHEAIGFLNHRPTVRWRVDADSVRQLEALAPHPDCHCTFDVGADVPPAADPQRPAVPVSTI